MITIRLNDEENTVLQELIEGAISEIRMEIADTDSPFYKEGLRSRKNNFITILEHLRTAKED